MEEKPPVNSGPGANGEPELPAKPQRGGVWTDILIGLVIVVVLLGGVGMAIANSDLFAAPPSTADPCAPNGCTKPPDTNCPERPVKALVTQGGEKLYYRGDHPSYTGIIAMHTERGDRWFCSEQTAAAAGFKPAP